MNHFNALEEGLDNRGALDCTEKMNGKIDKINEEIAKAENLQNEAMEHGRRLQLIIEICSKNRTQNELWIHVCSLQITSSLTFTIELELFGYQFQESYCL